MKLSTILFAALLATGCNSVTLVDDIDLQLDWNPVTGPSDALHSPYVQGASFTLWIRSQDNRERMLDWTVESGDAGRLSIEHPVHNSDQRQFYATAHAMAEGTPEIIVRDGSGNVLRRQTVEVLVPDRIDLLAHGLLLIGHTEEEARVSEARVRTGGTATFLSRSYRNGRFLAGNGAVSVDPNPDVTGHVEPTFLFENRDWVQLSPLQAGAFSVGLSVGGTTPVHVSDVPLPAVADTEVNALRILGQDESHAQKDEWLIALAQAYDGAQRSVYGVDYHWQVDGVEQVGYGDLYRYQYKPGAPRMLSAQFGGMQANAMLHVGAGYVASTNNVGCSTAPGSAPRPLALVLVLFLGYPFIRMSRYMRQLLLPGSSVSTDSHSARASSLRPSE